MMKIGTDIIEIKRVKKAIARPRFLRKYFTQKEMELIEKKGEKTAAANFAGKEAVAKALGSGFGFIAPKDIEILRDNNGTPVVNLNPRLQVDCNIQISLSHCREYAVAMVLIEDENLGGAAPKPPQGASPLTP
ncbi:MAG: holo-ACP synthase [Defluviitaleaceae bacterium]|nr:holo-ACP synthase [Defluviitaleaceae bacterium]